MTTPVRATIAMLFATSAALATPLQAGAEEIDPLRCEARRLRCESELYQCVSRCERRGPRELAAPAGARPVLADDACEARCADRHGETMRRIAATPPCAPGGTPDAGLCEARLLRLGAAGLVCRSRCGRAREREGVAGDACLDRCATRCAVAVADTMAQTICGRGRIGDAPLCD
jgi:hypothetical protein